MTKDEYCQQFTEDDAVGWDAIASTLEKIYGEQQAEHYGTAIPYVLGGEDPLDGISIYLSHEQEDHYHFVTYGFSELYFNEEAAGKEFSKFGMELTFRLKKVDADDNKTWGCSLMQNLARYVFDSGNWFDANHFIPTNSPIRLDSNTDLCGLAFTVDPQLGKIHTAHGEVQFLQMIGITSKEVEYLKQTNNQNEVLQLIQRMQQDNNLLLITDLQRAHSYLV